MYKPYEPPGATYRFDIDALRALAVAAVVIYHLADSALPFGYLGVDIFFVLSGYLITGIIWREVESGKFSLARFYERRIRRILPALLFLLIVVSAFAALILLPADLVGYAKSALATLAFSANIYFWRDTGYFSPSAEEKPLMHLWSLGVEEQFYIFFPVIILFLARFGPKIAVTVIWTLIVASFALNVFLLKASGHNPAFFLLPARAWELGIGAVLALSPQVARRQAWGVMGLAAIVFALIVPLPLPYYIPQAVLVVAGTAVFIWAGAPRGTMLGDILAAKPVNLLGLISYSLYLWHWPVIVFAHYWSVRDLTDLEAVGAGLLSVLLGYLSWRYVERPFRSRSIGFPKVGAVSAAGYGAMLAVAASIIVGGGFVQRLPEDAARINASVGTNFRCEVSSYFPFGASRACDLNLSSGGVSEARVVLLGNSHAQMYAPAVRDLLVEAHVPGMLVPLNACLPTASYNISVECRESAEKNLDAVLALPSLDIVVIAHDWPSATDVVGRDGQLKHANALDLVTKATMTLARKIEDSGRRVVIIGPIAVPGFDIASTLGRQIAFEKEERVATSVARSEWLETYGSVIAALEVSDFPVVRADLVQCDKAVCRFLDGGKSYFADSNHLAAGMLGRFKPALRSMFGSVGLEPST